ncbi:hypothetical protein ACO0QE_002782 [Hanseniaspora vineae]
MDNRLTFSSSNSNNEVTDENEAIARVSGVKSLHLDSKGDGKLVKNITRKPLAVKGNSNLLGSFPKSQFSSKDTPLVQVAQKNENGPVGLTNSKFNRPTMKHKNPVKVTHTGSFMIQNNNGQAPDKLNTNGNGGYRIQKSLVRQKSLVLNDFEEGNLGYTEKDKENVLDKDELERAEMANKLRAVFSKDSHNDENEEGYVTEETDSGSDFEDGDLALGSLRQPSNKTLFELLKPQSLKQLSAASQQEEKHHSVYDEIEHAPKREAPLPDAPEAYERLTHKDLKKLNTFSTPFHDLRSSSKNNFYPKESPNENPFKLLPLESFSDDESGIETRFTVQDLHPSSITKPNNQAKLNKDGLNTDHSTGSSPISLNFELPEYDGEGLNNDELDSFL